jgi:hypothetical protein
LRARHSPTKAPRSRRRAGDNGRPRRMLMGAVKAKKARNRVASPFFSPKAL